MSRFSASVATTGFALLLFAAAIPAQNQTVSQTLPETQPQAQTSLSTVRIVRLSEVRGAVQLDRGAGQGFEEAMVNMPVVQQSRLKTAMGVAEVEFEDNSTLRIGPNSEVIFYVLGRTDKGNTVSSVRVVKGIAYVDLVKTSGRVANDFTLAFGDQQNIQLQPDTHVRLEIYGQQEAKLAVLRGTVQLNAPNGSIDVPHKNTATFAMAGNTQPAVAKGISSDSLLDAWDKQLDQYHSKVASLTRFGGVPYSYGVSDMMYYGAFQNTDGCGMMWRPYFASMAWDPYSNGTWASYGSGYSWVSPYPWGWTPYHYGSWSFCPGTGYGWVPGGSWMGVNNVAAATPVKLVSGIGVVKRPRVTPRPPHIGGPSLVTVNRVALVHSGLDPRGSFVFRKDSAGLGIPRNELGSLRGFSRHADQRGVATTPIYISTTPNTSFGMRSVRSSPDPIAIHRGYAPSYGGYAGARTSASASSSTSTSASMPSTTSSMPSAPSMGAAHASGGGGRH